MGLLWGVCGGYGFIMRLIIDFIIFIVIVMIWWLMILEMLVLIVNVLFFLYEYK